ncbi:hypothetical protein chiPu_0026459, partial [Chiloscyllium punctatum]|nr:hypothetical protein [Chiloscyllium punctatum]
SKNAIGELNEYCQKRDWICKVVEVAKRGPSHTPEFTLKFVINDRSFPSASGKNKQEAKQRAAVLALNELQVFLKLCNILRDCAQYVLCNVVQCTRYV